MNYLLDTYLVSELFRNTPNPGVAEWITSNSDENTFISCVTVGEIQKGISKLPESGLSKRLQLQLEKFMEIYGDRILPLSREIFLQWGTLCAKSETRGVQLPILDSLIATTALAHGMEVVTRNVNDLDRYGARVVNPWVN